MTQIRQIELEDINELIELSKLNLEESRYRFISHDYQSVFTIFYNTVTEPEDNFGVLAESKGKIVGYLVGFKTPYNFNNNYYFSSDIFIYVHPNYRGKLLAKQMTKAFEKWSKDNNCLEITLGTITEIDTERTKKLYNKLGFETVGYFFRKKLQTKG